MPNGQNLRPITVATAVEGVTSAALAGHGNLSHIWLHSALAHATARALSFYVVPGQVGTMGGGRGACDTVADACDRADDSQKKCGCCVCSALVVVSLSLLLASLSAVGPLEYGLHFSSWSNKMVADGNGNFEPFTGGRYFVGLGHTFIRFPSRAVTIDFSNDPGAKSPPLSTRTGDGLPVLLEVALQYKLKKSALIQLYTELNVGYEAAFMRNARDALLEEAGAHLATDYWLHRQEIGQNMHSRLTEASGLKEFCDITGVQVLTVVLPPQYEQSILQTQVAVQQQKKATFDQLVAGIEAQTSQLSNTFNNTIDVMLRSATAEASQLRQQATAKAQMNSVFAEAAAYAEAQVMLNLTAEEVSAYRWYHAMMDPDLDDGSKRVLVNMNQNSIVNLGGGP
jgi:regulator of protease activity HflC (stomatin/prohibitin superfamily)